MKRHVLIAAALIAAFLAPMSVAQARARLVVVFPLRSTPELSSRASALSRDIVTQISNIDGFDARLMANPAGSALGAAAATVGAETYVVGQVVNGDTGLEITLGSFSSATDKSLGEYHTALTPQNTLPASMPLAGLLSAQSTVPPAASAAPAPEAGVLVPTGNPISITVDAPISSASAKVGDAFAFKAADEVIVDGFVVVRKGAEGKGEITVAEHSGGNGHPGKLGVQFDWVVGVDGNKIALSNTQRSEDGEEKKGASSTATIASYLVLGPLGLFAHNFVHGRDITLDDSKILKAYVDHTVHVVSTEQDVVPPGFAK